MVSTTGWKLLFGVKPLNLIFVYFFSFLSLKKIDLYNLETLFFQILQILLSLVI